MLRTCAGPSASPSAAAAARPRAPGVRCASADATVASEMTMAATSGWIFTGSCSSALHLVLDEAQQFSAFVVRQLGGRALDRTGSRHDADVVRVFVVQVGGEAPHHRPRFIR